MTIDGPLRLWSRPIRYEVMSSVPENWIPFIPVHVADSNREIQLQRAAVPRILDGDPNPPVKVQPRTVLLPPAAAPRFDFLVNQGQQTPQCNRLGLTGRNRCRVGGLLVILSSCAGYRLMPRFVRLLAGCARGCLRMAWAWRWGFITPSRGSRG